MARITVEDCLEQIPSRFALVHIASQRARRLLKGARPFVDTDNKLVVTALREVAAGYVVVETGEEKPVEQEVSPELLMSGEAAPEQAPEKAPEKASE